MMREINLRYDEKVTSIVSFDAMICGCMVRYAYRRMQVYGTKSTLTLMGTWFAKPENDT